MNPNTGVPAELAGRVYRRSPDMSFTRFGEEALVVVPRGAWQLVLSDTGARVLELLDGTRTVQAIAETIAAEYEGATGEQVLEDVVAVLEDLRERGAVELPGE